MNKTFDRHMATLRAGEVGESFIRGVTRAMNNADRRTKGLSVSKAFSGMSHGELAIIRKYTAEQKPRIEPKQSEKGLTWLRSRKVQNELGERERRIVADFDHFNLIGYKNAGNDLAFMIPIYRVTDKHGNQFDYYTGSWQSGVPLTVVG